MNNTATVFLRVLGRPLQSYFVWFISRNLYVGPVSFKFWGFLKVDVMSPRDFKKESKDKVGNILQSKT